MYEVLNSLVSFAWLFVVVPAVRYLLNVGEARRRWRPRAAEVVAVGDGGYRGAEVAALESLGPPAHVQVTAVMCWGLGVAFLPGLLAGLVGLLVGIGVISIPGLILAAQLFRLGGPLLRGEAEAVPRARAAARFARWLNCIVLGLAGLAAAGALVTAGRRDRGETLTFLFSIKLIVLYASISLVHARLLVRSAETLEAELNGQSVEDTGVRVSLTESPTWEAASEASTSRAEEPPASAQQRQG